MIDNPIMMFDVEFDGEYAAIPARMQASLRRYVLQGVKPGDFLQAVIVNDLRAAVGHADDENLPLLKLYVQWFYNVSPAGCHGTIEKMEEWVAARKKDTFQLP